MFLKFQRIFINIEVIMLIQNLSMLFKKFELKTSYITYLLPSLEPGKNSKLSNVVHPVHTITDFCY